MFKFTRAHGPSQYASSSVDWRLYLGHNRSEPGRRPCTRGRQLAMAQERAELPARAWSPQRGRRSPGRPPTS